jgi:hypothetical protein
LAVATLDISENGVRLMLREEVAAGQDVSVSLSPFGQGRPIILRGAIIWCVPTAEGHYCVGIRSDKPLPSAGLQDLTVY